MMPALSTGALYRRMVPANKKLDPEWVASLVKGGHALDAPIRGSKKEGSLDKIGMTVGGIACGTFSPCATRERWRSRRS